MPQTLFDLWYAAMYHRGEGKDKSVSKPKPKKLIGPKYTQEQINEAIWLYSKNKFSLAEIGRAMNVPKSTVHTWIRKHQKKREALENKI